MFGRHTCVRKMKFLCQGVQKFQSEEGRHTDRCDKMHYHAAFTDDQMTTTMLGNIRKMEHNERCQLEDEMR